MTTHFSTVPVGWALREANFPDCERCRPLAMVVNDDPMIAGTVSAILNGNGLAAFSFTLAASALDTARLIPPEILIADIGLRGMSGIDLALEITRGAPDCEVILLCGQGSMPGVAGPMCRRDRDFSILMKPVHPTDLLDGIRHLLARRGHPFGLHKPFGSRSLDDVLFGPESAGTSSPNHWIRARSRRPRQGTSVA